VAKETKSVYHLRILVSRVRFGDGIFFSGISTFFTVFSTMSSEIIFDFTRNQILLSEFFTSAVKIIVIEINPNLGFRYDEMNTI